MRRLGAALFVLFPLLLIDCAARRETVSFPPGPTGEPRRGGYAIFVREEDPDYLDPALSYGTYTAPIIEGIYRGLLEYADAPGPAGAELEPELAETMPDVREGGTLYAFKVRKDARFGKPLHRHITASTSIARSSGPIASRTARTRRWPASSRAAIRSTSGSPSRTPPSSACCR
jgi:hypothetical protein